MTWLKLLSLAALAATIVPSLLFAGGRVSYDTVTWTALAGTLVWFVATPLWMDRGRQVDDDQVEI